MRRTFYCTGQITAGELAERTGLTTGAVTGVIDRLEKAGLVRRAKDPDDRRRVIIEPFPERIGRQIGPLFESIGRAMANLSAQHSTQELAVIRDFIARFNQVTYEETGKLREGGGRKARQGLKANYIGVKEIANSMFEVAQSVGNGVLRTTRSPNYGPDGNSTIIDGARVSETRRRAPWPL